MPDIRTRTRISLVQLCPQDQLDVEDSIPLKGYTYMHTCIFNMKLGASIKLIHFFLNSFNNLFFYSALTASGILKGFDPLLNLVLDGTTEHLRGTLVYIRFC